jgi:integral membrane protein (TIGR01906 family)
MENEVRMNKSKNLISTLIIYILMILVITILVITSFKFAIYGDNKYSFYKKHYLKNQVLDELPGMNINNLMSLNDKMMNYLIGKEEKLTFVTNIDGKEQDFFNDNDRSHMLDVKNLFLGALTIRNIFLVLSIILIISLLLLNFKNKRYLLYKVALGYLISMAIFVIIFAVVGIMFSSNFDKYFEVFHQIFFPHGGYAFDPSVDYMIRMLPAEFFDAMLGRIGLCIIIPIVLLSLGSLAIIFIEKKKGIVLK